MNRRFAWIQIVPILMLGAGIWTYRHTQNEVRMQLVRAKQWWRDGESTAAIDLFQSIKQRHAQSHYAPEALWELAQIHFYSLARTEDAVGYYGELCTGYAGTELSARACLTQADIVEKELDDPERAQALWKAVLEREADESLREEALFRLGASHFRSNENKEAEENLKRLLEAPIDPIRAQQSRVMLAIISQIDGRYRESVRLFREVLDRGDCPDCKLQARLGLIQSYEFLNDLNRAIRIARDIPVGDFSAEMKDDLVNRLLEKSRYDKP